MTDQADQSVDQDAQAVLLIHAPEHPAIAALREKAHALQVELIEMDAKTLLASTDQADLADKPTHWIVAVGDDDVSAVMELAETRGATLGFLPVAGSTLPRLFDLPRSAAAQIDLALSGEPVAIDLTRCNGEIVLGVATIGDVPFLDQRGRAFLRTQPNAWRRWLAALGLLGGAVRRLFSIRPSAIRLSIGSEAKPRRTAVTGIVVMENDTDHLGSSLLGEQISARDARLSAMLLAPASVVAYLAVLGRAAFGGSSLPRALSFIRCGNLQIDSDQPLPYRLDGRRRSATSIAFTVAASALRIRPGARFTADNPVLVETRDTLRLRTLPENEQRLASITHGLPLFTHALEDDFKDLFLLLRSSALVTSDYVILMLAATSLAALGLVLNSAAVIIGAMVLAPLMAPIISLAMGVLRRDSSLIQGSARAIAIGMALALGVSSLMAWLLPLQPLTSEIQARLHPSLLDLAVAVISGIAGAYAYSRESVMKSLPGVAIAVALVPPLAVSGIGIGWGEPRIFGGALLLFITNLVGICAAAALTFLILGYAPIRTAAKGLRVLGIATLMLALPLYASLARIVEVWRIETQLRSVDFGHGDYQLTDPQVSLLEGTVVVRAVLASSQWITPEQAATLKSDLEAQLQRPVQLELDLRLVP